MHLFVQGHMKDGAVFGSVLKGGVEDAVHLVCIAEEDRWMVGWETEGEGSWFIPEGNGYVHLMTRRGSRGGERVGWRQFYGRLICEGKKNLHPNESACGEG